MTVLTLKWWDLDFEEFSKDVFKGQPLNSEISEEHDGNGDDNNNGNNDGYSEGSLLFENGFVLHCIVILFYLYDIPDLCGSCVNVNR